MAVESSTAKAYRFLQRYLISLCTTCLLQCGQNLFSSIRAVVLRRFLVDV